MNTAMVTNPIYRDLEVRAIALVAMVITMMLLLYLNHCGWL